MIVMFTGVFYLSFFLLCSWSFFTNHSWNTKQDLEWHENMNLFPRNMLSWTHYDSISHALMDKLTQFGYPFVLVVENLKQALELHDMNVPVMLGNLDEAETFQNAAIDQAAMVVATDDDIRNVNIAFRARDAAPELTVVSTCNRATSEEILSLAGATHVIRSAKQMGSFLARRISCTDNNTHLIGTFDEVQIAEATVHGTPLVGKQLKDTNLRDEFGVNVVGMWERGHFQLKQPQC